LRLIVAISGASGVIYGIRMLEALKEEKVETHLIVSRWAEKIIEYETSLTVEQIKKMADYSYEVEDLAASIASGSSDFLGMVIIPCSTKTLAAIANGYSENLIHRCAEVMLKEKCKLVVAPRETPLNLIHLRNMVKLAEAGVIIAPLMPPYYHQPKTIDELINQMVGKILNIFGVKSRFYKEWKKPF